MHGAVVLFFGRNLLGLLAAFFLSILFLLSVPLLLLYLFFSAGRTVELGL
jgi:hypothetical protein